MLKICSHGTDIDSYCEKCNGVITINPSKKIIGIYLDVTGSMLGTKIDKAKIAIEKVLEKVSHDSMVALTIFSTILKNNYEDIIPYGSNLSTEIKLKALDRIKTINVGGNTPLYEAINHFLDNIWNNGSLNLEKTSFPLTYLIIISDGEENRSNIDNLIYENKIGKDAFFAKLKTYRKVGLVKEIIPFAYGYGKNIQLVEELKEISSNILVNEINPDLIMDALSGRIDLIQSNLELDTISIINLKTIKDKENRLIENPKLLKDKIFLKNLLKDIEEIEEMISKYRSLDKILNIVPNMKRIKNTHFCRGGRAD